MCVDHNPAGFALPVNIRQAYARDGAAVQNIPQNISGTHAGKLVGVADQNQAASGLHSPQQRTHQHQVDHGGLVGNDAVRLQRMILIPGKDSLFSAVFQQPVDGLRFTACRFGHALGGTAGRRAEDDAVVRGKQFKDTVDDGGLSGAGTAGNDENAVFQRLRDGFALAGGEADPVALFKAGDGAGGAGEPVRPDGTHQLTDPQGNLLLGVPEGGQVNPPGIALPVTFPDQ